MLFLVSTVAVAAELHLELKTEDGISETVSWAPSDSFTRRFGPVQTKSNGSAVYVVTVPNAVFDAIDNLYHVDVSVCVEWSRKGKNDRLCQKDELSAPAEASGKSQHDVAVKSKIDFDWTVSLWYTGEPPVPLGLPAPPPPEPEDDL
jgi:hypothetical protein